MSTPPTQTTGAPAAPEGPLLVDQLRFMARAGGERIAYANLDTATSITFREWDERSNQVARWLTDHHVARQDRVALYMDSDHCLEWIVAYAGIHKAGAVAVPVNTRLSLDEVLTILRHAEPAAVITNPRLVENTRAVEAELPLRAVLVTTSWDDLDSYDASYVQVPLDADDIADIMYTSGTTGLPKGVLVRHRNVAMIPNTVPTWTNLGWLHGAPLFTFAGMSFIFNPMKMGLSGLYMPKFDVDHWFDVVERDRPMMIFLVPAMAELITASSRFAAADLSAPLAVSIGSAPLAPATLKTLQERMPQASVINSYGLTEAGPAFITMPKEEADKRVGSVGKPNPPMEVRVVDPDTDGDCAPNEVGELLVRLPGKRREYYKDDGANASTWTPDGWLRTGDLAYLDSDGFVYISGRIKDMIIRGGNNVYATDVEAVILEHPDVQEAAVVGVPHQVLGEDIGAFVVRKPPSTLSGDALAAFCRERLADYKQPRRVWFVDELPRNATGKVMKHRLRDIAARE
ncbi:MAG TPA: class I adenylate-forming enzyme family protein [Acidimicrobiia bacterium]|nr:class I adenylate-forming enzyme family protein [Acidimicrobiia bacterium]